MRKKNKKINDFERSSYDYFKEISNFTPLTRDEEVSLWERYKKQNDLSARDKIIKSNLKFVATVAKPYVGLGLSYSDLIAEGNIGLMKAMDKFDYEKGFKTISYSVWWIRQTILEALNKRNIINGDDSEFKNEDIDNELIQENYVDIDKKDEKYIEDVILLNDKNDDEVKAVSMLFNCLNERESSIIKYYYGLGDEDEMTLEEIGNKFDLTKERIRQIKEIALKKLRTEALKRSITTDIYR